MGIKLTSATKFATFLFALFVGFSFAGQGAAVAADTYQNSATMRDSIEATLKNNPNIKAFQEYRQSAEFDRKRARSGFLPKLDARAGWGYEQWSDSGTRTKTGTNQKDDKFYERYDGTLTLTQTIWDGLGAWSRYRLADAMLTSAEHRLFDNAEALTLDAILAHIEVFRQRRMVELSEVNVANHMRILDSQTQRQRAGATSRADVTQTQARLARAEASLVESRMALDAAIANYKKLTGFDVGGLETPYQPNYAFPSLENALANSMTNNSKVMAKRADVDATYAQKELDKAAFHPHIYLEAGGTYRNQNEGSDTYQWGTNVQVRAQWNLYNGHYDWYNLKSNKARIRQNNRELQALRDNLAEETTNTWNQWMAAKEQVKFYSNAIIYNTETKDMYLEQFNVGQRSLLDLLDSENELYSSSMQLVTAQMNEIAAQYRLLTLGGKILEYFEVNKDGIAIETDDVDFTDDDLAGYTINNHSYLPE